MASLSSSSSVFGNIADQARTWWETSSSSTKIISVGLAVILIMALIGAAMLATAPDYQDLFTGLDPQDASAIATALDNDHVKYQLANNDTTIRVPASQKDQLRMEMVSKGLPSKSGSVLGSDFLDKIGPGTTTDLQNQYIRMANEAELSKTIGSLDEIGSSTVHLSPGNDSPFVGDSSPASASVVVGLKPGMTLSNDQVMGIANLVAKSVPGLDLKNVVVVDTNGNQLWDGGNNPNGPGGSAANKILAEQQVSEDKRKQYQAYLDEVLGPHKSLVSVTTELNYDQSHSLSTTYGKGFPISSQDSSEQFKGVGNVRPSGPAGLTGNAPGAAIPTYPQGGAVSQGGDYQNETVTTNMDPDKTQTETQKAPGSIQRLDVAVLIDSSIAADTVTKIQNYLQTLAGVTAGDPTRVVTVESVPFSNTAVVAEQSQVNALAAQERMAAIMRMVAVAAVVGVLLFIFLRAGSSKGGHPIPHAQPMLAAQPVGVLPTMAAPEPPMLEEEPLRIEDVLAEMPEVEQRPRRKPVIPSIEEHVDVKLESMRDMARHSPQSVALLIKGWMAEDIGEA
jgi:flagellar M-ring protein FliF